MAHKRTIIAYNREMKRVEVATSSRLAPHDRYSLFALQQQLTEDLRQMLLAPGGSMLAVPG